jgi:hypothetical protein
MLPKRVGKPKIIASYSGSSLGSHTGTSYYLLHPSVAPIFCKIVSFRISGTLLMIAIPPPS